jgi:hypothetical protein
MKIRFNHPRVRTWDSSMISCWDKSLSSLISAARPLGAHFVCDHVRVLVDATTISSWLDLKGYFCTAREAAGQEASPPTSDTRSRL